MRPVGIEPTTSSVSRKHSATELRALYVGVVGIEPTTFPLSGERSTTELHARLNYALSLLQPQGFVPLQIKLDSGTGILARGECRENIITQKTNEVNNRSDGEGEKQNPNDKKHCVLR